MKGRFFSGRTVFSLVLVLLSLFVVVSAGLYGKGSRVYAPGSSVINIQSPEQAYQLWRANGVRGRTLLLFGREPYLERVNPDEGVPALTPLNFIQYSISNNIVRKIYLIVPDEGWEQFKRSNYCNRPLRDVAGMERGRYLHSVPGVLFIATTPSCLGDIGEKPLVYIDTDLFDSLKVQQMLSAMGIAPDIIITCGRWG